MPQKILDAKDKAGNRPRTERKRYLNIIYFIDSSRTRTLKFSIRTSYLTVGTLCLLVGWSFVASLLLIRSYGHNMELRSRSRNLLSVIFNYQTRYDQVYEKAYPDDGNSLVSSKSDADQASPPQIAAAKEPEQPAPQGKTASPVQPEAARAAIVALAAKAAPPAPEPVLETSLPEPTEKTATSPGNAAAGEPTIAVENFSTSVRDKTLTVRFSMKNTLKGNKASGTVTVQARFFEKDKEGVWLQTQASETKTTTADQDDPSDQHYNIRYYKNKVFHFTSPSKRNGIFTAVKIQIKDEEGRTKEFSFPLTKEPRVQSNRVDPNEPDPEDDIITP